VPPAGDRLAAVGGWSPRIGSTLGHDEILEFLGEGGMGEVRAARDTRLDREVALKLPPAETAEDPERRLRFEREAKAIAALNHPDIVTVYSVEESDGRPKVLDFGLAKLREDRQPLPGVDGMLLPTLPGCFSVSRDGRSICLIRTTREADVWILDLP
jgi:serine/threonine protein kinase